MGKMTGEDWLWREGGNCKQKHERWNVGEGIALSLSGIRKGQPGQFPPDGGQMSEGLCDQDPTGPLRRRDWAGTGLARPHSGATNFFWFVMMALEPLLTFRQGKCGCFPFGGHDMCVDGLSRTRGEGELAGVSLASPIVRLTVRVAVRCDTVAGPRMSLGDGGGGRGTRHRQVVGTFAWYN